MPHFGIETLGHGPGGFLDQINTSPIVTGLFGTSTVITTASGIPVLQTERLNRITESAATSTRDILQRQNITQLLGQASVDVTNALSENIQIREDQRARDNEAVANQQIQINQINERLSGQVTDLGQSLEDLASGASNPLEFLTQNPLFLGLGIGGIAVGAIVLLLLIKK